MSRLFDGIDDLLSRAAVVTAAPFTAVCWMRNPDTTADETVASHTDGSENKFVWDFKGSAADDLLECEAASSATNGAASSTDSPNADVWGHIAHVQASATSRASYSEGGNKGTDTTSVTPSGIDTFVIGEDGEGMGGNFNGNIAHFAIWNVALTDSEIASLATGFISPLQVRRDALIHYWPLNGVHSPETDIVGGATLALTSAPTKDFEPPASHSILAA